MKNQVIHYFKYLNKWQNIEKPVIIEAVQWNGTNHLITETFMKGSGAIIDYLERQLGIIKIPILEGQMLDVILLKE